MTPKTPTVGARLAADLDAALAHASEEVGRQLEFDEAERHVIDQAVAAADCAEEMHAMYRAELARDEPRPTAVVKYAAEMRLQQKQAVDFVARVKLGLGAARSPQHVRAAQTRWQREQRPQRPTRGA
jgi:hypothetical protein